jgi:hypothetical protein
VGWLFALFTKLRVRRLLLSARFICSDRAKILDLLFWKTALFKSCFLLILCFGTAYFHSHANQKLRGQIRSTQDGRYHRYGRALSIFLAGKGVVLPAFSVSVGTLFFERNTSFNSPFE